MNNKVSIVLPVYNVGKYLEQCIESIVNQSYQNLEILILDDGSTDNSAEICDKWGKNDHRITVVHKQNEGLGNTRNLGISMMTGDYVIFLDSDDWFDKDYIYNLVKIATEEMCDVVVPSTKIVKQNGEYLSTFKMVELGSFSGLEIRNNIVLQTISAPITSKNDITLPQGADKLYKTNLITGNNLQFYSERDVLGEDILFNTNLYRFCKKINLSDEDGYNYRMNLGSISNTYSRERSIRGEAYYYKLKEIVGKYEYGEESLFHIYRSYLGKCRVAIRLIINSDNTLKWKCDELDFLLGLKATRESIRNYPISRYGLSLYIVSICIRCKFKIGLIILYKLRKYRKNNKV